MAEHYTDEDHAAAVAAILQAYDEIFCEGLDRKAGPAENAGAKAYATAVLDAIAPAIAARALREVAESLAEGIVPMSSPHYSRADAEDEASVEWLRARADEIEGR